VHFSSALKKNFYATLAIWLLQPLPMKLATRLNIDRDNKNKIVMAINLNNFFMAPPIGYCLGKCDITGIPFSFQ
jgi:TRAP-type mannitol/chloroaromatic compound transport system permease large subunit